MALSWHEHWKCENGVCTSRGWYGTDEGFEEFLILKAGINFRTGAECQVTCGGEPITEHVYYNCENGVCVQSFMEDTQANYDAFIAGAPNWFYTLEQCEAACAGAVSDHTYWKCVQSAPVGFNYKGTDGAFEALLSSAPEAYGTEAECAAVCTVESPSQWMYYRVVRNECTANEFVGTEAEYNRYVGSPYHHATMEDCQATLPQPGEPEPGPSGWYLFKFIKMFFGNFFGGNK